MTKNINNFLFRVDAANEIGTGHVMRCLAFADFLKKKYQANCFFLMRLHNGHLCQMVQEKGFEVIELSLYQQPLIYSESNPSYDSWLGVDYQTDALECINHIKQLVIKVDWLVVDHYGIDGRWHKLLRPYIEKIFVIDDLANRTYHCDLLLNQTYGSTEEQYKNIVQSDCQLLLGSQYVLLRPIFSKVRHKAIKKRKKTSRAKSCFICIGGADLQDRTLQLLTLLQDLEHDIVFHVIIAAASSQFNTVQNLATQNPNIIIHTMPTNVAQLMLDVDFAIGAAGTMTWERACLGLPTIMYCIADNQKQICSQLSANQAVIYMGNINQASKSQLLSAVELLINDNTLYQSLVERSLKLCDGEGVVRVGEMLYG